MITTPNYDTLRAAFAEMKDLENKLAMIADTAAEIVNRNPRKVSGYELAKLKRALRSFNLKTSRWSN